MNSEEAIVAEDTDQQVKVPLRRSTRERRTVRKPVYFSEEQHSSTQNGTKKQHGDAESSSISKEIAGEEGRMSQESSESSDDEVVTNDDSSSENTMSSSEQSSVDESSDDESSNSGSSEPQDPSEYNWETEGHRFIGKRVHRTTLVLLPKGCRSIYHQTERTARYSTFYMTMVMRRIWMKKNVPKLLKSIVE